MMNCETVRDLLLTDYLDDELDAATRAEVDAHLRTCPSCAREHELIVKTLSVPADDRAPVHPRRDLWPQIEKKIETEAAARSNQPPRTPETNGVSRSSADTRARRRAYLLRLLIIALLAVSWNLYHRQTTQNPMTGSSQTQQDLDTELVTVEDRSAEWLIFRAPQPETDRELHLDDLQKQHLSAFRQLFRSAHLARKAAWQTRRKELNDLLGTSTTDKEVMTSKRRELHDLADSILKARLQEVHRIRDLLTPEQRAALLTLFQAATR